MPKSTPGKRAQGLVSRQDVEVHFGTVLSGIPCDADMHYYSLIPSGLGGHNDWGNKVRVSGVRVSAVDASGVVQALGNAYINFQLFVERVGNAAEYHRTKVAIAFEAYDGQTASTDYDEIDTKGQFNDILVDESDSDAVHFAVGIFGAASGVDVTDIALTMRGNIVF